jgi:hypothetical protein
MISGANEEKNIAPERNTAVHLNRIVLLRIGISWVITNPENTSGKTYFLLLSNRQASPVSTHYI